MTPDTLMSLSVNAAVCPITEEREKEVGSAQDGRGPRHLRTGASLGGGSHQAEQMHGGSPRVREAGPEEQLGAWRARPRRGSNSILGPPAPDAPRAPVRSPRPQPKAESRHARAGGPDPTHLSSAITTASNMS